MTIRSLLEYCAPAWSPFYIQDIDKLESVQRRCLKLASSEIILPTLTDRRKQADLCEAYKFISGSYVTSSDTYFTPAERQLRGHSKKLQKQYSRTLIRKYFFSNRVVDDWNKLSEKTINTLSLTSFKKDLAE